MSLCTELLASCSHGSSVSSISKDTRSHCSFRAFEGSGEREYLVRSVASRRGRGSSGSTGGRRGFFNEPTPDGGISPNRSREL